MVEFHQTVLELRAPARQRHLKVRPLVPYDGFRATFNLLTVLGCRAVCHQCQCWEHETRPCKVWPRPYPSPKRMNLRGVESVTSLATHFSFLGTFLMDPILPYFCMHKVSL